MRSSPLLACGLTVALALGFACLIDCTPVFAQDTAAAAAAPATPPPPTVEEMVPKLWMAADTVWVLVCGMLVFFMNLGFGCVESGFARAKNAVNILSKNFIVFAATAVAYYLIGWDLMFGAGDGAWIGNSGSWMVGGADNSPAMGDKYQGVYGAINWTNVPLWAKFFFQLVFAGTAATIVSGAVAERIKYHTFILFSFLMAIVIYPVTGHWIWGFGYLAKEWNFWDFAGCSAVHSVGGWAASAPPSPATPMVLPGLKPNQPNQSTRQPMKAAVMLWPGRACTLPVDEYLPIRGPRM
jgi:Amt family ammonium transporter